MKKSEIFEFIPPDVEGAKLDRYAIAEMVQDMNAFLSRQCDDFIKVTSYLTSISYIDVQGDKTAELISKVTTLCKRDGTFNVHITDTDGTFQITMRSESKAAIGEEDAQKIIELARAAGFFIGIDTECGTIVIQCDARSKNAVTISAQDAPHRFYNKLLEAFAK